MDPKKQISRLKVLLIDDDEVSMPALCRALAKASNDTFEFEHAELLSTGLERLSKGGIDLILLDLNLPDSRGSDSISRVHSCAPQVPIIVISYLDYSDRARELVRRGAQDFVAKPCRPEELARLVCAMHAAIERKLAGNVACAPDIAREIGVRERVINIVNQERQEKAKELYRANNELWRAKRELEELVHVVAHDFQTPLRAACSYLALLERRYNDQLHDEAKRLIVKSTECITAIQGMSEALLTYFHSMTKPIQFELVDVNQIMQKVIADMRPTIEASKAVVTHSRLPEVMADSAMLRQSLQCLLDNALKFRSEAPPAVHLGAEQKDSTWQFSIRDNGIGVASDDFERIFRPFIRLHTSQQYSGMGIGLAVCARIVQRHGGRIWAESERGKGATFHFTIPMPGEARSDKS